VPAARPLSAITPAVGDTPEGVKTTRLGVLEAGVVQDVEELGAPRLQLRTCGVVFSRFALPYQGNAADDRALQVLMWALD
jgi:hypothetical protein